MKTTWQEIRAILRKTLDSGVFRVWVEPLEADTTESGLVVTTPNSFMADWIKGHLLDDISRAYALASGSTGETGDIAIHVRDGGTGKKPVSVKKVIAEALPKTGSAQNALPIKCAPVSSTPIWRYKFDDFVIGASNNLAVAAARDLCQSGQVHSLFVTSASGLGKTHLAQAAGQLASQSGKPLKISYLTAEQFATRYVAAMKSRDLEDLKHYLCSLDILVFEDVHFLQKKKAMQEFALTVIKNLEARGARVIFTSSFSPRELQDMDSQLTSYFCAGIMANMEKPDLGMRKQILRQKAKTHHVLLPEEVCDALSQNISSDIRQLESCLQNMIFKSKLLNSGLTLDLAMETMSQFANTHQSLDMEGILKLVCESFGVTETQLRSRSRRHDYVQGRNTVFFLARKHTDLSLESIGNALNRRHSTVLRSITQVEKELAAESREGKQIARTVALIERRCGYAAADMK